MIFRIKETEKQFAVTLRVWENDCQNWSPDCYDDVGVTDWERFPRYNDDENIRLISQDDFNKLVEWWTDEVDYFNSGNDSISIHAARVGSDSH